MNIKTELQKDPLFFMNRTFIADKKNYNYVLQTLKDKDFSELEKYSITHGRYNGKYIVNIKGNLATYKKNDIKFYLNKMKVLGDIIYYRVFVNINNKIVRSPYYDYKVQINNDIVNVHGSLISIDAHLYDMAQKTIEMKKNKKNTSLKEEKNFLF